MRSILDLNGEWVGHYPGHFDEFVKIIQRGEQAEAVKITGDEHVPAGAVTWRANVRTGLGEDQIAEMEFRNPRFIPAGSKCSTRNTSSSRGKIAVKSNSAVTNKIFPVGQTPDEPRII